MKTMTISKTATKTMPKTKQRLSRAERKLKMNPSLKYAKRRREVNKTADRSLRIGSQAALRAQRANFTKSKKS